VACSTRYLVGEPPWRTPVKTVALRSPPIIVAIYSRRFVRLFLRLSILRSRNYSWFSSRFLLPTRLVPFLSILLRKFGRWTRNWSCPGESSDNYRCRFEEAEAKWGEMRWDVPLWQPSAEYWLGVITVTVEKTPTNLTFNNETLVRVTSAWLRYIWRAKHQSEKRKRENFIVNAFSLKCFAYNMHMLNIYYNLLYGNNSGFLKRFK